jgi:hypothetical protein
MKIPQNANAGKKIIRDPIAIPIGSPEPIKATDLSATKTR